MLKRFSLLYLCGQLYVAAASAGTCPAHPVVLTNGTTADADQVMADFDNILNCANNNLAPLAGPSFTGNVGVGASLAIGYPYALQVGDGSVDSRTLLWSNNSYALAIMQGASSNGRFYIGASAAAAPDVIFSNTLGLEKMRLTNVGFLGLGTSSPAAALDVRGYADFGVSSAVDYAAPLSGSAVEANLTSNSLIAVGESALGNANPAITLYRTTSGARRGTAMRIYQPDSLGTLYIQRGSIDAVYGTESYTTRVTIDSGGSVGIGTTSPATALQVVGDIRMGTSGTNGCVQDFSGSPIAGTCSSDQRLKTILEPVTGILSGITKLELVKYRWNEVANALYHNSTATTNIGYVAQAVEKQFPGLVSVDKRGYKQINYTNLQLYGLEALKELKTENDKQREKISVLEKQMVELRQELTAFKRSKLALAQ